MAAAGFLHVGGGAKHGHAGHGGQGMARGGGHGHHSHGQGHAHGAKGHARTSGAKIGLKSLFSLSPIDFFSYCAGAGAAGILFRPYVERQYLPIMAIVGALAFDLGITRVIATLLGKFVADPSQGLEGSVAQAGEAVTNFDAQGQGLIRLTLDGQIIQLLATLEEHEHQAGVRVRRGDPLLVVQVDSRRNRCMVTRELAQAPLDAPI